MPITRPMRSYRIKAITLRVVREHAPARGRLLCSGPKEVVAAIRELDLLPDEARERFVCLMLDAQNGLIGTHTVSIGTLTASLVSPREVFRAAIVLPGVASIVLAHNHPSGDPTPSQEDIRLTRQLAEAGQLLDIRVHDHVILGDGPEAAYVSLADRGNI